MCDFKPGDEVVYVGGDVGLPGIGQSQLSKGSVYVVFSVHLHPHFDLVGVRVVGYGPVVVANSFRKVERRNDSLSIEAFLTIKPGFEEPKRAPAKKRERV